MIYLDGALGRLARGIPREPPIRERTSVEASPPSHTTSARSIARAEAGAGHPALSRGDRDLERTGGAADAAVCDEPRAAHVDSGAVAEGLAEPARRVTGAGRLGRMKYCPTSISSSLPGSLARVSGGRPPRTPERSLELASPPLISKGPRARPPRSYRQQPMLIRAWSAGGERSHP